MQTQLEQKTQLYWRTSKCYYGQSRETISTEQALKQLTDVEAQLFIDRKLKSKVTRLIDEVIGCNESPEEMNHGLAAMAGNSVHTLPPTDGDAA